MVKKAIGKGLNGISFKKGADFHLYKYILSVKAGSNMKLTALFVRTKIGVLFTCWSAKFFTLTVYGAPSIIIFNVSVKHDS